jgi:hypothetical protein
MTDTHPIVPRPGRGRTTSLLKVRVEPHQFKRLERAAVNRNATPLELVTRIVQTVLDHNLINAVLDDDADKQAAGVSRTG